MVVSDATENLICDNAFDCDRLDAELGFKSRRGDCSTSSEPKELTQDRRWLKRCQRDGKSSDCLPGCRTAGAWSLRYERHVQNSLRMLQFGLGWSLILLKHL